MTKNKILFFLILFAILIVPIIAFASGELGTTPNRLLNPLGDGTTPQTLIGKVIIAALGIVGSIALLMFIYGGFVWMTAAGNQEMVTRGRNILLWAAIGLVVIFSSYALVKFVFTAIGA